MYAKVFAQIYDGSLCTKGPWQALVTFQQMLVLADQDGTVDMTAGAIARRTTLPLEIIETGIAELQLPDPESRTPAEDGRRIVRLSEDRTWGWRIVNYKQYREMKREEDRREYHRDYWHKRKLKDSTGTQQTQPSQPIAEAKAEAKAVIDIAPTVLVGKPDAYRVPDCPFQDVLDAYHAGCPSLPRVRIVTGQRQKLARDRWVQVCSDEKWSKQEALEWFSSFFSRIVERSDFLTGRAGGRGRTWKADFQWLMTAGNFAKVVEGRYAKEAA